MQFLSCTGHISRAPDAHEGVAATRENTGTNYRSVHTTGMVAFTPVAPTGIANVHYDKIREAFDPLSHVIL